MADAEQLELLKNYVVGWNRWRAENPSIAVDLSKAALEGADLHFADLSGADLSRANLRGADLCGTNLNGTFLQGADLLGAALEGAHLSFADLSRANLVGAQFVRTVFGGTDLSDARGLEKCRHWGPSALDHWTLEKSGMLPTRFLRGVGLTDWQIEAAKLNQVDLTNSEITGIVYEVDRLRASLPIQITNLFISYTRDDGDFVDHMQKKLDEKGVRHWRDVHDAPAGPLEAILIRAMSDSTVLLILSERSVESDWVRFEAEKARQLEKTLGRHILCPIALDDAWKNCDWPERLRLQIMDYNVLDFSDWKSDDFKEKFDKLLSGLKLYFTPAG